MRRRKKSLTAHMVKGVGRELGTIGTGVVSGLLDLLMVWPRRKRRR